MSMNPIPASIDDRDGQIPLADGSIYRPFDEDPGFLSLKNLATGLSNTYRFAGNLESPISIATHSILTAKIHMELYPNEHNLHLACLLHDAAEAPLHDIQATLRHKIMIPVGGKMIDWNENDVRLTKIIGSQWSLDPNVFDHESVARCDRFALMVEIKSYPSITWTPSGESLPKEIQGWSIEPDPKSKDSFIQAFRDIQRPRRALGLHRH